MISRPLHSVLVCTQDKRQRLWLEYWMPPSPKFPHVKKLDSRVLLGSGDPLQVRVLWKTILSLGHTIEGDDRILALPFLLPKHQSTLHPTHTTLTIATQASAMDIKAMGPPIMDWPSKTVSQKWNLSSLQGGSLQHFITVMERWPKQHADFVFLIP